jgi:hypothetical protein
MLPLAHVGMVILISRAARADTPSAVLGALTPDLLDKPLAWIIKVTPSGRYFGHSLLCCLLLSLMLVRFSSRRAGLGFGLGYLTHLAGDIEGHVPLLMPFVAYDHPRDDHFDLRLLRRLLLREAMGLALIIFFASRSRKGKC